MLAAGMCIPTALFHPLELDNKNKVHLFCGLSEKKRTFANINGD